MEIKKFLQGFSQNVIDYFKCYTFQVKWNQNGFQYTKYDTEMNHV